MVCIFTPWIVPFEKHKFLIWIYFSLSTNFMFGDFISCFRNLCLTEHRGDILYSIPYKPYCFFLLHWDSRSIWIIFFVWCETGVSITFPLHQTSYWKDHPLFTALLCSFCHKSSVHVCLVLHPGYILLHWFVYCCANNSMLF